MPALPITTVFDDLPDPRRRTENKLHRLTDILVITTCAVIGGAETWEAIAEYGRTKRAFFRRFLPLDNGIPSADTFGRVFAKLAPGAFAQAFGRWMAAACEATGLVPVAIDGKSARAAKRNTATGCLTVVTAWATENRLVLGQVAVPDGSNEIGAIPDLLRALDLSGAIVTIDAAGCQTENARLIRGQGGHYLLAVKDNQPTLRAAVERVVEFAVAPAARQSRAHDRAHRCAADKVDRHPRIAQGAHRAKMREGARTTTRQHEADAAPGEKARKPRDAFVVRSEMEEPRGSRGGEPCGGHARACCAITQEDKIDETVVLQRFRGAHGAIRWWRRVGIADDEHAVGLPAAPERPGEIVGIGSEQDIIAARFRAIDPVRVGRRGTIEDNGAKAALAHLLRNPMRKRSGVDVGGRGGKEDDTRHCRLDRGRAGPLCRKARQLAHRGRTRMRHGEKAFRRDALKHCISYGKHIGTVRRVRERRHFADRAATANEAQRRPGASGAGAINGKHAAANEINRVCCFAGTEEVCPALEADPSPAACFGGVENVLDHCSKKPLRGALGTNICRPLPTTIRRSVDIRKTTHIRADEISLFYQFRRALADGATASGSRTSNVVPTSVSLLTVSDPLCISTMRIAIARPRPAP